MPQVIGTQTFVLAVDPEGTRDLAPNPLSHGPGGPRVKSVKLSPVINSEMAL